MKVLLVDHILYCILDQSKIKVLSSEEEIGKADPRVWGISWGNSLSGDGDFEYDPSHGARDRAGSGI